MTEDREGAQYEPSHLRLQRAREHGMVPYSAMISQALQWSCGVGVIVLAAGFLARGLAEWTAEIWQFNSLANLPALWQSSATWGGVWLGVMALIFVGACSGPWLQKGFQTPRAQLFDINRLMPFTQRRAQTWGERGWFALLRSGQLALGVTGTYIYGRQQLSKVRLLTQLTETAWLQCLAEIVGGLALLLAAVVVLVALPDYGFQWWLHRQRLKMTDEELREENRTEEGHPDLRRRRRQQASMLARSRSQVHPRAAEIPPNSSDPRQSAPLR